MKILIKKYLQGGGLPIPIYLPVVTTLGSSGPDVAQIAIGLLNGNSGSSSGSSLSKADKGELTEKDLFSGLYKAIAEQGLMSDAQYIISKLLLDLFNDSLIDPFGNSSDITSKYLKALSYLNTAKSNLKEYDNAYTLAVNKNSLGETAVTSNGGVVVKKGNKLTVVTPEEYKQNKESYLLLTNGNILALRYNSKPFDNSLLEIVLSSTSMKEIMETVKSFVEGLGKYEDGFEGYTKREAEQIKGGLAILGTAASKYGGEKVADMIKNNGLYKVGITNEDQVKQVQMALSALMTTLSEPERALLKIKTDGTDKGVMALLSLLLNKNTSAKFLFTVDLDHGKDGKSSSSSSGDGEDKIKLGPEETYYLGLGEKKPLTFLNKTKYAFTVLNTLSRLLTDGTGKNTGVTTADSLGKSTYSNLFYLSQATLGGQRIEESSLRKILIDGTITTAVLPIDLEAKNGDENIIKPDFNSLKNLEYADKQIKAQNIDTSIIDKAQAKQLNGEQLTEQEKTLLKLVIEKVNKIYQLHGLPLMYDLNGKLTPFYLRFTMVNAKAPEGVFSPRTNWSDTGLEEIKDQDQIDSIRDAINDGRSKEDRLNTTDKGWFGWDRTWLLDYDRWFIGTLCIPMKESFIDAYTDNLNPSLANMIEAQEQFNIRLKGGLKE